MILNKIKLKFLEKLNVFLGNVSEVSSQDDQDSFEEETNSEA